MSIFPAIHGALYPAPLAPVRWFLEWSPSTIDEGAGTILYVTPSNYVVGAQLRLWWYGLSGAFNWRTPWPTAIKEACEAVGCTYVPDVAPNVLGNISGLLILGPGYAGERIAIRNAARANRKDDVPTNPDGTPGSRSVSYAINGATTTGTIKSIGPFTLSIRDTSRTPAGSPSIRIQALADDGVSVAKNVFVEGESFYVRFLTENILPGTSIKTYIANVGQTRFLPAFRRAIIDYLATRNDVTFTYTNFPTPPGVSYYQGATFTFLDNYRDSNPIQFLVTTKKDDIVQGGEQADFIANVVAEGDLQEFSTVSDRSTWSSTATYRYGDLALYLDDGQNYVYIGSGATKGNLPTDPAFWRVYTKTIVYAGSFSRTVRDAPPRYWELAAKSNGSTITYTINVPTGSAGASSIVLTSGGTKPPGFDAAFAAALAAHPEIVTSSGGRLYAMAETLAPSELVFTVPHPAGTPGKHTLRFSDKQGPGWIVIEDAVVFLTKPAMPVEPKFITGTNLDGGEFGRKADTGFDNYNTNYRYPHRIFRPIPEQRHVVMDYHWSKGSRLFRFPILSGRIIDELFGPLMRNDPPVTDNDRADMWRIDECIDYWTRVLGGWVLLDIHNFGKGKNGNYRYDYDLPDVDGTPIAALSDLWVKLAERYKNNPKVWLGIMNEPNSPLYNDVHSPTRNRDNMQAVVNAIRARTDSVSKILVAAADFSSAGRLVTNGNAEALEKFYDPLNNHAFEVHVYFDSDSSGTNGACVSNSRTRINDATQWALRTGNQLLLGEFGVGDPTVSGQQICRVEEPAMLETIRTNKAAWLGWTAYFGGDMWGPTFVFGIDPAYPADYTLPVIDKEQMKLIVPFFEINM